MIEQQLKQITKIVKAVADEGRLRILCLLKNKKDLCVCEITEIIGLAQPTISSHLKLLENAGFIESTKSGHWINYSIARSIDPLSDQFIGMLYKNLENDRQIRIDEKNSKKVNRDEICKKINR